MRVTLLPGAAEQARAEAAGADAVTAGLARALLEAAEGQAGARFTLFRALAQAKVPPEPGAELRRRVTAAVACRAAHSVDEMLAHAYPGLHAKLNLAGEETAGQMPDVLPFEVGQSGRVAFTLPHSMFTSPHLPHLLGRWLAALPVFAAYAGAGAERTGRSVLNLGARQKQAGVAFSGNRPAAWLIPDPEFLASGGHGAARQNAVAAGWSGRAPGLFWRGNPADRQRVSGALAAAGEGLATLPGGGRPGECRMALDLAGPASGSAGLFALLLGGGALLRVASADGSRIWFDARLVPWTHYLPVAADMSDLAERVDWVVAHPAEAQQIGAAARMLARSVSYEAEIAAAVRTVGAALK